MRIFKAAQNVDVIGKADYAYPRGSSRISSTLHGASILLRLASSWDWFIPLNAGDYPLVTQDGNKKNFFWDFFLDLTVWVCFLIGFLLCVFVEIADLLHILSYLPKDLNFANHTSYIGWKEYVNFLSTVLVSAKWN